MQHSAKTLPSAKPSLPSVIALGKARVYYSVNGSLTEQIIASPGLRQGDPLSPYLFLLCAEGFSGLINAAEERGSIQGVTICAGAPSITHLLFADDLLVAASPETK